MQSCLVNLFHLDPPRNGGSSRVAREICQMLAQWEQKQELDVIFAVGWRVASTFADWIAYPHAKILPVVPEMDISRLLTSLQPDVLLSPLPNIHPFDAPDILPDVPHIVTIPDTLPLDKPQLVQSDHSTSVQKNYAILHQATVVVTHSMFSYQRLMHHLGLPPEKVVVIPHIGDFTFSAAAQPLADGLCPFVFYPANGWLHKRHDLLLQMMNEVWRSRPELKLVLSGWQEPDYIPGLVQQYGCPPEKIIELGYVPDDQLAWLYIQAEALLFISEYEGFGRPILEAMSYDCPVICAPHAAIPEVAGDAALYVTTDDVQGWANAFLNQLPDQRAALIARGQERVKHIIGPQHVHEQWIRVFSQVGMKLSSITPVSRQSTLGDIPLNVYQELVGWAARYAQLYGEAEAKEAELQHLLERLKSGEQSLAALQTDLSARSEALIAAQEAQVTGQNELLESVHTVLELQKQVANLQLEVTTKENSLQIQQMKFEEVLRQLDEAVAAQAEVEELYLKLEDKETQLQHYQTKYDGLRQQLAVAGEMQTEAENLQAKRADQKTSAEQMELELQAKEAVIAELLAFYNAWQRFRWLIRPLYYVERWAKNNFGPRLGHLNHYLPIPLVLPDRYNNSSVPANPVRISIVTPTLNQAHFLEYTLDSVLDQCYPDLEYVVQDGGSSDETCTILARYENRLAHCETRPDNGQAHALNLGFARTSGEIMAYLNSDDILLPGALNSIAAYFADHPDVDVVYGHRILIDENDQEVGRWVLPGHDKEILKWADYIPQETLFWRRHIWDKAGGYVDESFKFALDWDLLLRFQDAGAKIVRLPRFLGAFRVHQNQKSSAQIHEVGHNEMSRLRERCHGRTVSYQQINRAIRPYLIRSVVHHKLYRLGILRY